MQLLLGLLEQVLRSGASNEAEPGVQWPLCRGHLVHCSPGLAGVPGPFPGCGEEVGPPVA